MKWRAAKNYRVRRPSSYIFLILTFAGSTIRNCWATPLAAATPTIRELALFKGSYISRLYGRSLHCDVVLWIHVIDAICRKLQSHSFHSNIKAGKRIPTCLPCFPNITQKKNTKMLISTQQWTQGMSTILHYTCGPSHSKLIKRVVKHFSCATFYIQKSG